VNTRLLPTFSFSDFPVLLIISVWLMTVN
jgi:hypothetical protein